MYKSVICECCLSTAAQGRPARFRTTVRWRWLALHQNRWEAFKQSFAAGTTWKPYHPAEVSTILLQLFWRGSFNTTRIVALYFLFAKMTCQRTTVATHWEAALKNKSGFFSVCYVTINNSVLLWRASKRQQIILTLLFLIIYTLLQP